MSVESGVKLDEKLISIAEEEGMIRRPMPVVRSEEVIASTSEINKRDISDAHYEGFPVMKK